MRTRAAKIDRLRGIVDNFERPGQTGAMAVRRREVGFTLLETLAVLVLIGLLMGLLFPALGAVRASSLRQRTRWQFQSLSAGLSAYVLHYGHRPDFFPDPEQPLALTSEFVEALGGVDVDAPPSPQNPDNVRFHEFSSGELDGQRRPVDAFGCKNLFIMARDSRKLHIPRSAFPEFIRSRVPEQGIAEPFALWSLDDKGRLKGISWEEE